MKSILNLLITNVYAENVANTFCADLGGTLKIVSILLLIVRIAVPLVLVGMATMDLYKVVTDGKDSELQKQIKVLGTRVVIGIIVFFIPTLIRIVVNAVADDQSDYLVCVSCLDNPANCSGENKKPDNTSMITTTRTTKEYTGNSNDKENSSTSGGSTGNSSNTSGDGIPSSERSSTTITEITAKGVVINVNTNPVNGVKAYYFTYNDNKFPGKTAGYIETTKTNIQVGRLPGTTYVWVEDNDGKISQSQKITIDNSVILRTSSPILKGRTLKDVFIANGTTYQEFDKLIARSARAAGAYSKEAAATVAVTLISVLDKEYGVRIPYRAGGKYNFLGINYTWGKPTGEKEYPYYGLDCDGFTHWSYYNAGVKIDTSRQHNYWYWKDEIKFSKDELEIGDIIAQNTPNAHVKIVVGFTDTGVIVAHANGTGAGVWINEHKYTDTSGDYSIIKGSKIESYYEHNSALGSGF